MTKTFLLILALLAGSSPIFSQGKTRFQPSPEEMLKRYQRAAVIDSVTRNAVVKQSVTPHWSVDGKAFWYCNVLKDSVEEYLYVETGSLSKKPLFEPLPLAASLKAIGISIDPRRPSLKDLALPSPGIMTFQAGGQLITCNLDSYVCVSKGAVAAPALSAGRRNTQRNPAFPDGGVSPDKKWEAYLDSGNLFVKSLSGGSAIQFTKDGTTDRPYGGIRWSPDGSYLAGYHIRLVKDDSVYYILTSEDSTTRGQLRGQAYKQPGDPWTIYTPFVFLMDLKKPVRINADSIDFLTAPQQRWRDGDAGHFLYQQTDRGHQRFRIIEVDVAANTTRNIVNEQTQTFIYESRNFVRFLPGNRLLIRTSEKDGWRQIYLVNTLTGAEKQVTKGQWVVRSVDSIDVKKEEVWFTASGMNAGEDPYNIHYYRTGFNGKKLVTLTPQKGNHTLSYNQDGSLFVDTYSEVNVAPKSHLGQSSDGKVLIPLEEADLSLLTSTGVMVPEVFVAKGRDGKTDIWGIVSKPSDLDTNKIYPVLENIYAGPHDSFVPKKFTPYSEMQSLAEHGFIVVMIDGMGSATRYVDSGGTFVSASPTISIRSPCNL